MSSSRLQRLHDAGQSIWLDFIDRGILRDGELERLIREDALTGMTSNPTIFEKALAEGTAYDDELRAAPAGATAMELFELVETADVRAACDVFSTVHHRTGGADGYVSIEVSPASANDSHATIAEAQRLWATVDRPNVMIKVPGTADGAVAVRALIGEGINVNITLLFSVEAHRQVIAAYLGGLEDRVDAGKPIDGIASVASFFVSRVDSAVDRRLEELAAQRSASERDRLLALRGRTAIANAKMAYQLFRQEFSTQRWQRLAAQGGRRQRPLWASTSTKNPAYRDVMYVEELIGPDTVNTMPPATLEAFRDHGEVRRSVDEDVAGAERHLAALQSAGVELERITDRLLVEGLASFQRSFDSLIVGLEQKRAQLAGEPYATR